MHLLRSMFWLSAKYNFVVKAKYIPGSTNVVADAISRLHEDGRLLQVESLVNQWYFELGSSNVAFHASSICNFMSLGSMYTIFQQVMAWRRLRGYWTAE